MTLFNICISNNIKTIHSITNHFMYKHTTIIANEREVNTECNSNHTSMT